MSNMLELESFDADNFETGIWFPVQGDSELKIARAGNTEYLNEYQRLEKSFRKEHGNKLTPEQQQSLNCQAMSKGLLKDWKNVTLNGEVVKYTSELGAKYLKRNPKLLSYVLEKANDLEAWERENTEEEKKKR